MVSAEVGFFRLRRGDVLRGLRAVTLAAGPLPPASAACQTNIVVAAAAGLVESMCCSQVTTDRQEGKEITVTVATAVCLFEVTGRAGAAKLEAGHYLCRAPRYTRRQGGRGGRSNEQSKSAILA